MKKENSKRKTIVLYVVAIVAAAIIFSVALNIFFGLLSVLFNIVVFAMAVFVGLYLFDVFKASKKNKKKDR